MQLDTLLSAADPARHAHIDEADSPGATALYRRIVATPPSHGGGEVAASWVGGALRGAAAPRAPRPVLRRRAPAAVAAAAAVIAAALGAVALAGGLRETPRVHSPATRPGRLNQAAGVLDALARVAAGRPAWNPGPGRYLYVLTVELSINSIVRFNGKPPRGARFPACDSQIDQEWQASDSLSGRIVGSYPRCAGRTGWSGESWGPRGEPFDSHFDYIGWQGLPAKPAAMKAAIVRRFEGGHADNARTFWLATDLLNVEAPPAMRAAEFRMLATLPGVRYLGKVTDPLGRTGDVLALPQKTPGSVAAIVDPKTSQLLSYIDVVGRWPSHLANRISPWLDNFMYVETGIVRSSTATPPGTNKLLSDVESRYRHWVKPGRW
jgi:hypothetical protein